MRKLFTRLFKEEEGQGLTEYALILGAIAIAVIIILIAIGGQINSIFQGVRTDLENVAP